MSSIMFVFSIFIFVLILGMFQSNQENFGIPHPDYIWGLRDEESKRRDDNRDDDRHHRRRRRHRRWEPDDNEEKEVVIDKQMGEYQCRYVPGEDPDCKKAFQKCSIKDHPDINKYILKSRIPPMPDMNNYILKTEIPIVQQDMSEYIHNNDLPDMSQFIPKDQLPDMSEYIPKKDLDKYQKQCPEPSKCPTFPECPTCPIPEGIDMDKYMLKEKCNKKDYKITDDNQVNFGDLLPSFMRGKAKCVIDDDFRRQSYQKRC